MINLSVPLIEEHKNALEKFVQCSQQIIFQISKSIINCIERGGTIYLCGNGGSAADCQHLAGEFVGRFKRNRRPLPAIALSTDTSVLTCIGNDYSYNDIFVRQVEVLVNNGDILWTFSTSGTSANIIKAAKRAKQKEANVIAFTGKAKSELEELSDICLCSNTNFTSTAQEIHMLAYHIICELIDQHFSESN